MTSTNFCYFLQGYLELTNNKTISAKDLARIKGHLRLAFRDDIDPSMGDAEHQENLNNIHTFGMNDDDVGDYLGNLKPSERC
jgi:hypothetical protein